MLIGERCVLRPFRSEDARVIAEIGNNIEARKYLQNVIPFTELGEMDFVESLSREMSSPAPRRIVFAVEVDGKVVGATGLERINWISRNCYFAIAIYDPDYWNRGIGTEATKLMVSYAFEFLNMHKILLEVYDYNERAIRVYQKVGFEIEGRLRKNHYFNGRYHDTLVMGILSEEYFGSSLEGSGQYSPDEVPSEQ